MPWWAVLLIVLNVVSIIQHAITHIDIDALIHAWANEDDDMNDVIAQGNSCVFKNQDYGRWANERTS